MRTAAFFDMDHTLVNANSGSLYVKWKRSKGGISRTEMFRYLRWLAQYSVGLVDAVEIQARGALALRGLPVPEFEAELEGFYERCLRPAITTAARAEVERRRARGDVLVILSASMPFAVHPLARDLGIEHTLCSELETEAGHFTGRFERLCYGRAKVDAALAFAAIHGIDLERSAFYTDSISDAPLLDRVGEPRIVNPDPRLRFHARKRGWRIENWS